MSQSAELRTNVALRLASLFLFSLLRCNLCIFVAIHALFSWCTKCRDLRVSGAKKTESWVASQKNRISSPDNEDHDDDDDSDNEDEDDDYDEESGYCDFDEANNFFFLQKRCWK